VSAGKALAGSAMLRFCSGHDDSLFADSKEKLLLSKHFLLDLGEKFYH